MLAVSIYFLCAIASVFCAYLLCRSFLRNRNGLVFWTAVAFLLLAMNNFFVVADFVLFPGKDYSLFRTIPLAMASGVLAFGLIWESV